MTQDLTQFDDLRRAHHEAQRFPLLSAEEERRLAERWRATKDPAAADQLIGSHLRLVIKIARRFGGYGVPIGDLIAEGNAGLAHALTKFESERGFRFATYAMWWIKSAMQEHVLHNESLVKMGTTAAQKKLFFNLRRLKSQLGELGEGDISPDAADTIAEELGVTVDEVMTTNRRLSAGDRSLATPVANDSDLTWEDTLEAEGDDQDSVVAEASELAWRRELLAEGMSVLGDRERHILSERRLKDDPTTLEGLSQVYAVSRERIRQIEVRAFQKVQKVILAEAAKGATGANHAVA